MGEDNKEGSLHSASPGGVHGLHSSADSPKFLVAPATAAESNNARFGLIPIACWRVDDIRFAFNSSFVAADVLADPAGTPNDIRTELQNLVTLVKGNPGCPLSVFGHADPVGDDEYNKLLSGRRAMAIYALLIFNTDSGAALKIWRDIAAKENWGSSQREMMQSLTGLPAGTQDAALIQAYLPKLCPTALKLAKTDFLAQGADSNGKGDYQGCGEFNPILIFSKEDQDRFDRAARGDKKDPDNKATLAERDNANSPNRRVLVLMFRKGTRVTPAKWPCPSALDGTAACRKRFWSDGDFRRSNHIPGSRRTFQHTHDTFACRFFQRISDGSPCHAPISFATLIIRLVDVYHKPIKASKYTLEVGEIRLAGQTDDSGLLTQRIPDTATTARLTLPMWTVDLIIRPQDPIDKADGLRRRLNNLGFFAEDPGDDPSSLALMRFQSVCDEQQKDEQNSDGTMNDSTRDKLKAAYGS